MTKEEWFRQTLKIYIDRIINNPTETSGWFKLDPQLGWTGRALIKALKDNGYKQDSCHGLDEGFLNIKFKNEFSEINISWSIYDFDLCCSVLKI